MATIRYQTKDHRNYRSNLLRGFGESAVFHMLVFGWLTLPISGPPGRTWAVACKVASGLIALFAKGCVESGFFSTWVPAVVTWIVAHLACAFVAGFMNRDPA